MTPIRSCTGTRPRAPVTTGATALDVVRLHPDPAGTAEHPNIPILGPRRLRLLQEFAPTQRRPKSRRSARSPHLARSCSSQSAIATPDQYRVGLRVQVRCVRPTRYGMSLQDFSSRTSSSWTSGVSDITSTTSGDLSEGMRTENEWQDRDPASFCTGFQQTFKPPRTSRSISTRSQQPTRPWFIPIASRAARHRP